MSLHRMRKLPRSSAPIDVRVRAAGYGIVVLALLGAYRAWLMPRPPTSGRCDDEAQGCAPSPLGRERPDSQWVWENPAPLGDPWIRGGWVLGARDAWVVGERGTVLRWQGKWSRVPVSGTDDLLGIWAVASDDVWAVGANCTVLRWQGRAFTKHTLDGCEKRALRGVGGSSAKDVWVVGEGGFIAHFDGTRWTPAKGTRRSLAAVWAASPTDAWAVGSEVTHWDGRSWSAVELPGANPGSIPLRGVWSSGPDDVWVVGGRKTMHWNGSAWEPAKGSESDRMSAVWGSGPADVWTAGRESIAHFDGARWTTTPRPETNLGTLAGAGRKEVWAFGTYDVVRWDGREWRALSTMVSRYNFLTSVHGTSAKDLWAVGERGILHRDAGGWSPASCAPSTPPGACGGSAVWAHRPDDAWIVGSGGRALHWDGDTWKSVSTGTQIHLRAVWGSGPRDVWAVGSDPNILHWDGSTWSKTPSPSPKTLQLTGLWGTGPNDVWAAGTPLLHWDGRAWAEVTTATIPSGGSGLWGTGPSDVWLGGLEKVGGTGLTSVQHWDGTRWSTTGAPFPTRALWGGDGGELWAIGGASGQGGRGALRHLQRGTWSEVDGITDQRMQSAWGDRKSMWIVGENAAILRRDR